VSTTSTVQPSHQTVEISRRLLIWATVIGAAGSLLALAYYYALHFLIVLVWDKLVGLTPLSLPLIPTWNPAIIVVTATGGLIVGLLTRWLGAAGEIAAVVDNIHLDHGRISMRQTPSMVATSLVGITAGGSAGPEAPLVQIVGSCASWLGDRLKMNGQTVRTFTFCGMATALGAFFGAPLGGAVFALEIPHRRGIEYHESLLPAVVSALVAFLLFHSIVGYENVLFHFQQQEPMSLTTVLWGVFFGAIGALFAKLFAVTFELVGHVGEALRKSPVLLATSGGLLIGFLAQVSPMTLFWGEFQIDRVINLGDALLQTHSKLSAVSLLVGLALVKILAISVTLRSGFRGGFIFPLMFVGAAIGTAATLLLPTAPAAAITIATMAAINVGITKTPISTSIILVTLTGLSMLPVVIAASVVSLLCTGNVSLINTQRERTL
jgi:H+/Cl- antiporter ClcA